MTSRPIPIKATSPRGPTSSRGRISQSLPIAPRSPHFGSLKAPPDLVEAMPSLELPQSVTDISTIKTIARSAPGNDLIHSFRISSKTSRQLQQQGPLVEGDENVGGASSLGQSLVSALSSLRVRNTILETELDHPENQDDDELQQDQQKELFKPISHPPLPTTSVSKIPLSTVSTSPSTTSNRKPGVLTATTKTTSPRLVIEEEEDSDVEHGGEAGGEEELQFELS